MLQLPQLRPAECPVCKALKLSDSGQIQSIGQAIMLLAIGRSAYSICVYCKRAVSRPWTRAYKARWARYEKRLQRNREKKKEWQT